MTDANIISTASRAVPETNTFMIGHIGGLGYVGGPKVNKEDIALDTQVEYTKEQTKIIDHQNDKLYKRDQHDQTFDIAPQGYNRIATIHPLGADMMANHSDKGFDYRDFPRELIKDHEFYDPYIGYLHRKGLIGKNKSRYTSYFINIDSAFRNINSTIKSKLTTRVDNNPFLFNGQFVRIYMNNTDNFSLNDKISISGVQERELTLRSTIKDDFGNNVNYFLTEENIQYMTISADNNMQINSEFTADTKDLYTDMMIDLRGLTGDKKTEWYFDTRQYKWEFLSLLPLMSTLPIIPGQPVWTLKITEDVFAVTEVSSTLPENLQIKAYMLIAEFKIDAYGTVVEITPGFPYNADDLRWTEPSQFVGQGTNLPQSIPTSYYTDALNALILENLNNVPSVPTTIYKTMEYFDKVQNTIRSILLYTMTVNNSNFVLRFLAANKIYPTTVRIVVPENEKITTISTIGNISLNVLNSKHRMFLTSADVERDLGIYNATTTSSTDIPMSNKFYIKLNVPYMKRRFEFTNPLLSGALLIRVYEESTSDVTISYRHYGGVPIKMINAEFPTGFKSVAGFKYIKDIVKNSYIVVELDRVGFLNKRFGGNSVYISLVEDIDIGYPNPNSYSIDLERVYTNVVMIRMINSCFPVTQKVIMDGLKGGRRNNRFYWQNADDGEIIYKIELMIGNYSRSELKDQFESEVRKVSRVGDNINMMSSAINHIFLDINDKSDVVTFSSYNLYDPDNDNNIEDVYVKKTRLSSINELCTNALQTISSIAQPLLDPEDVYYQYPFGDYFKNFPTNNLPCDSIRIKIIHPGHSVTVGQQIIIANSLNYEDIPAKYLNGTHVVTRIGLDNYDILLTNVNLDSSLDMMIKGGNEIIIYTPNLFRLRFDFSDTFGSELGFRDVGNETSISPYLFSVSNDIPYDDEELVNVIQNITNTIPPDLELNRLNVNTNTIHTHGAINLTGPSYILMTCKEIPKSKGLGVIKDYFYKIMLDAPLDSFAIDSFVDSPVLLNDPTNNLNNLTLNIYAPDGTLYDFNGIDHSFVLEIVTFDEIPEGTSIRSY